MTSIVDIRDPAYVYVCIQGTLEIDAYHFTEEVQQRVNSAIASLLAFENVNFEDTLYLSKVYEAIEAIERGASVVVAAPTGSGKTLIAEAAIEIALADGKRAKTWSWLPGFRSRERAVVYFETIVFTAPFSDYAPLALMNAAKGYKKMNETPAAIDSLDRMIST